MRWAKSNLNGFWWLPWGLALVALGLIVVAAPFGLVLGMFWAALFAIFRTVAWSMGYRSGRRWIGWLLLGVCFLGAFEGGWFLIPAGAAFLFVDSRSKPAPPAWRDGARLELIAGLASAAVGWLALALIAFGPLYSAAYSSTGAPGGSGPSETVPTSLWAVGITGRAAVVLLVAAVTLALVAIGSVSHARWDANWGRLLIGLAAVVLSGIVLAGMLTIGPWLVPAAVLALLAWIAGRTNNRRLVP